jgi:FkbM family methyltransferase
MIDESPGHETAAASATGRYELALELHAGGRSREGMRVLAEEVRERLQDLTLLNDLAVMAVSDGSIVTGEAGLRTVAALGGSEAVSDNIRALDEIRGQGFIARLMKELVAWSAAPDLPDNFDPATHPDGPPGPKFDLDAGTALVMRDAPVLEELYRSWADDASRRVMVRVFALALLGARKVQMPITSERVRELKLLASRMAVADAVAVDLDFLGWSTRRYDLSPVGHQILVDLHPLNVVETFLHEQYACPEHPEARVRPGDVVIDGGACWGDSALYFASRTGPTGRVVSFELTAANQKVFESNLALNPHLAPQIEIEARALWHKSEETLTFDIHGPGTSVTSGGGSQSVQTRAIDDLPGTLGIERVDFIKLDIEGAELQALRGAEAVLRRYRPRLAVAIYHRPDDWIEIPGFLRNLNLGYEFSLAHFTPHHWETVLFAWPGERDLVDA